MEQVTSLKRAICSLFDVHSDEGGVQRVVTPLEYAGTGDRIVVRVRVRDDGSMDIDENGEAAFYAGLSGGDIESEVVNRWALDLPNHSPVRFSSDEVLRAKVTDERLIAPYIFRVAEAAQQLFALASSRADRQASDFKDRVSEVIVKTANDLELSYHSDVELPIAGGLVADHVIDSATPLIVIAATSVARLLEAEVIHMQYRMSKKDGFVLAIAESPTAVGKKQFERANYYTGKTVSFSPHDLSQLIAGYAN
ncbi:hypothetical protein QO239_22890 [Cupriavidus taiwanensis]|uniref:hypothetical protein n=1 Tax=Cupriavidus taiwanensis TaxID=164546 RepID=UPI0025419B1E|nr:hypothetical protein [Cupriavidus taiwanensis]MDK3025449.1 hypothetical protein [Cupriavidus taiwanensis]